MNNTLVVDLDGTLVKTDTFCELLFPIIAKNPLLIISALFILIKGGKASLKEYINSISSLDVSLLPYNKEVLSYISERKKRGDRIILATGATESMAQRVVGHTGLFDEVFATTATRGNLTGKNKAKLLVKKFGHHFTYMGNDLIDNEVWNICDKAIVISQDKSILKAQHKLECHIKHDKNSLQHLLKAIRPHHWIKNLLIFLAPLMNLEILHGGLLFNNMIAFICFCATASSIYLFNDCCDLSSDRQSSEKRKRPIAAGQLDILHAVSLAIILILFSLTLSLLFLPYTFSGLILIYIVLNYLYSLYLKKIIFMDLFVLVSFYLLRIMAGTLSGHFEVSFWPLAFFGCLFLGMACFKRYIELKIKEKKVPGRGYHINMVQTIYRISLVAHLLTLVILILYIFSNRVTQFYRNPYLLILELIPISLFLINLHIDVKRKNVLNSDLISYILKRKYWNFFVGMFFSHHFLCRKILIEKKTFHGLPEKTFTNHIDNGPFFCLFFVYSQRIASIQNLAPSQFFL